VEVGDPRGGVKAISMGGVTWRLFTPSAFLGDSFLACFRYPLSEFILNLGKLNERAKNEW
jgi:hypothetical protein